MFLHLVGPKAEKVMSVVILCLMKEKKFSPADILSLPYPRPPIVSEQPLALSRRDVQRLMAEGKERCNGRCMNEVNVGVENASGLKAEN